MSPSLGYDNIASTFESKQQLLETGEGHTHGEP